jgi:hypothetical protein
MAWVVLAVTMTGLVLVAACGGDDDANDADAATTGADAATTAADAATSADADPNPPDADPNTPDAAPAADASVCPSRAGITAGVGQVLVIQSVSFSTDTIVVRNIGNETVSFTPDGNFGQPNWRVYVDTQATGANLPANFPIAAGATVRLHLRTAGTDDAENIYFDWSANGADLEPQTSGDGAEAAILAPNNGNQDPAAMRAYVRWGGDDAIGPTHTLRDEAAAAGMWAGDNPGDFVFVFASDEGITIDGDGDATEPLQYTNAAPAECL